MQSSQILWDNRKLLGVFLAYCLSLFFFAFVYELQYKQNPESFAFNSDVLRAQKESSKEAVKAIKAQEERLLKLLQEQARALSQLSDILKAVDAVGVTYEMDMETLHQVPRADFRTSDFRLVFQGIAQEVQMETRFSVSVRFFDKEGNKIGDKDVPDYVTANFPDRGSQYQDLISAVTHNLERQLTGVQRRISELETSNPEVWTYWDFLYFSTVTQTTVGYGDILPNNTSVRMTVILQVLLGLSFLVVVINLSFGKITRPVREADDRK